MHTSQNCKCLHHFLLQIDIHLRIHLDIRYDILHHVQTHHHVFVHLLGALDHLLFHGIIASYILHNGDVVLIGASGAISGVLGVAAAAGNSRAYYWLVLQIVFAVIGSVSALPIAFTAHVGGFIAGVLMTKVLVKLEQTKRKKSRYFLQP